MLTTLKPVLLVTLLCFVVCYDAKHSPNSPNISYQLHSWDDLREWEQGFKKGAEYFKVDIHYARSQFCQSQNITDPRGCFVLTHDSPIPQRKYNTSDDIVQWLSNPKYAKYLTRKESKIFFGLCFKYDGESLCNDSNFLSLGDSLFDSYNSVIERFGLNVEFFLDGSATPTLPDNACLVNRWRPWNATFISAQNSHDIIFSNNVTLGYDRFQILDEEAVWINPTYYIKILEQINYGKFQNSTYPFLIWEPSDQKSILAVSDTYLSGQIHQPGFRFAINIDPVMFEVFASSRSGYGWNLHYIEGAGRPKIATRISIDDTVSITVYQDSVTGQLYYKISYISGVLQNIKDVHTAPLPQPYPGFLSRVDSFSQSNGFFLAADHINNVFVLYVFDEVDEVLEPYSEGKFKPDIIKKHQTQATTDVTLFATGTKDIQLGIIRTSVVEDNLHFTVYDFTSDLKEIRKVESSSLRTNEGTVIRTSLALISSQQQHQQQDSNCPTQGVVVFSNQLNQTFAMGLCVEEDGVISAAAEGQSTMIGVGNLPTISIMKNPRNTTESYALITNGAGHCLNSHTHNTANFPAVCDRSHVSTPYVLSYTFGLFADLWNRITQQGDQGSSAAALITNCDDSILHGTYDRGENPHSTLFVDQDGNMGLLAVHDGFPSNVTNDFGECGPALPYDGIVLDSWNLPLKTLNL